MMLIAEFEDGTYQPIADIIAEEARTMIDDDIRWREREMLRGKDVPVPVVYALWDRGRSGYFRREEIEP